MAFEVNLGAAVFPINDWRFRSVVYEYRFMTNCKYVLTTCENVQAAGAACLTSDLAAPVSFLQSPASGLTFDLPLTSAGVPHLRGGQPSRLRGRLVPLHERHRLQPVRADLRLVVQRRLRQRRQTVRVSGPT